jgi:flagellar hook assembly protein FlgD
MLFLNHNQTRAQQQHVAAASAMTKSVVSAGAVSSSGAMKLKGTVGQPVIGVSSDASTIVHQGFWYGLTSTATSIGDIYASSASGIALSAWPNPFNSITSVSFTLEQSGQVSISVHDIAGRAIQLVADGQYAVGSHQVEWKGLNYYGVSVPSGTYFIIARTRSGQQHNVRTSIARVLRTR